MSVILAIESSCDDTGCALLHSDGALLAENLFSQLEPAQLGGVVPEVAARAHLAHIGPIVKKTVADAGLSLSDIDYFCASTGPGLIGGLIVGANFAQGLAIAQNKPFIQINHIEGHALSPLIPPSPLVDHADPMGKFEPYLLLLVSGGHCQLVGVERVGSYRYLGGTIDDACGEAFDKTAKLLGLSWPGGPNLERLAETGNAAAFDLPKPLCRQDNCDFSFSGLKTAMCRLVDQFDEKELPLHAPDIAASFQATVAHVLDNRTRNALKRFPQAKSLCVAGGVAANKTVRAALENLATENDLGFYAPPMKLCTDNAVMIAYAALRRLNANAPTRPTDIRPRWPLEEMNF